ncbi:hypothetical protein AB0I51_33600 [Streptomyces sp. NPDC050549]|uniref:hypothetical protein n=1 Tax=Streptomyces sp. NPDC050549 TaxID=3155406 RepID=UPI0034404299
MTSYWAAEAPSLRSADGKYALVLAHVTDTENDQDKTVGAIVDHDLEKAGDAVLVRPAGPLGVSHEIGVKVKKGIALAEGIAVPLTLSGPGRGLDRGSDHAPRHGAAARRRGEPLSLRGPHPDLGGAGTRGVPGPGLTPGAHAHSASGLGTGR